jgi:hypothetical protein
MKPIKAVAVAVHYDHIVVVDDKRRVWQRYADMKVGEWGQIPLPEEPRPKQRRRKRLRP